MTSLQPIPVLLVAGFLGSGKTTLMRRIIKDGHARGLKLTLVVNEFGVTDIDSQLLREAGAELASSLAGGCACCSGQEEMLWTLLEIGAREGDNRPDVIVMEASGLADPVVLFDVLTVAHLLPFVRIGALVSVVDSARFLLMPPETIPLMFRQIVLADFIVQNKIDIAYKTEHRAMHADVTKELREVNAHAPIAATKGCDFDLAPVWNRVLDIESEPQKMPDDSPHKNEAPHAHTNTVSCPVGEIERAKLEELCHQLPRNVWRAKGFVRLKGEKGLFLLQFVGAALYKEPFLDIVPFKMALPFGVEKPQSALVFIGPDLDKDAILRDFGGQSSTRLMMLPMVKS